MYEALGSQCLTLLIVVQTIVLTNLLQKNFIKKLVESERLQK